MACTPLIYSGINKVAKLLTGQSIQYTVSIEAPSVPGCHCGDQVHQPVTVTSSNTDVTCTIDSYPALPFSPCGAPFTLVFTITIGPNAIAGDGAILDFTFDQTGPNQFHYYQLVRVVELKTGDNYLNLGDLCTGMVSSLQICNESDAQTTVFFDSCTCPDLVWDTDQLTIDACACATNGLSYYGTGIGPQFCDLGLTDANGGFYNVTAQWTGVLCPITWKEWSIKDKNALVPYDSSSYSPDCDTDPIGVIGEYKSVTIVSNTLVQPLVVGDVLYFSQWQFAQVPDWAFQYFPTAGWSWRVCSEGEGGIDGTWDMEWYGQSPSVENSVDTPYITLTIANGGTDITLVLNTHLAADAIYEPTDAGYQTHDMFLKNSLMNQNELNNTAYNSVYANPKWWAFALSVYRTTYDLYQQAFLSIRSRFQFYDETQPSGATATDILYSIQSGEALQYFSTVRSTNVRIEFDWSQHPTPPDGALLQLIRNDTNQPQEDLYSNYQLNLADLVGSVTDGLISTITTPVTYSGAGTRYYAEVVISQIPGYNPGESVPNSYRFQLYLYDIGTTSVFGNCSDVIQTIDYDDTKITFNDLVVNFADVEQDYLPTDNNMQFPVHMAMETKFYWDSTLDDAQVQNKTGNVIMTAKEAVESIELRMFKSDPVTGKPLLINTQYFNPSVLNVCGGAVNQSAQNSQPALVDRSSGGVFDLTFPFTIPDDALTQVTRANLFQSSTADPYNWQTLTAGSLDCVAVTAGCTQYLIQRADDVTTGAYIAAQSVAYIPDIDEVWYPDNGTGVIIRYQASTRVLLTAITMPVGSQPFRLIYLSGMSEVYVSTPGDPAGLMAVDIYSFAITPIIGFTGTTPRNLCRYQAPGVDLVYVGCTGSNDIHYIDVATNTETGSIAMGTQPEELIYADGYIWVSEQSGANVYQIDPGTNTVIATISLGVSLNNLMAFNQSLNQIYVIGTLTTDLSIIDTLTATVAGVITLTSNQGAIAYNTGDSQIYCANANHLISIDPATGLITNDYYLPSLSPYTILIMNSINQMWIGEQSFFTPFLIQPCGDNQLPTFSWAAQNIDLEWRINMKFFGNTETYITPQRLYQVTPPLKEAGGTGGGEIVIDIDVPDPTTGGWLPGNPCIGDRTAFRVTATFANPRKVYSVGFEIQPTRGTFYTDTTTDAVAAPYIDPVVSPYITNITPATFGYTSSIQFEVNYPEVPNGNDVSMDIVIVSKP